MNSHVHKAVHNPEIVYMPPSEFDGGEDMSPSARNVWARPPSANILRSSSLSHVGGVATVTAAASASHSRALMLPGLHAVQSRFSESRQHVIRFRLVNVQLRAYKTQLLAEGIHLLVSLIVRLRIDELLRRKHAQG